MLVLENYNFKIKTTQYRDRLGCELETCRVSQFGALNFFNRTMSPQKCCYSADSQLIAKLKYWLTFWHKVCSSYKTQYHWYDSYRTVVCLC